MTRPRIDLQHVEFNARTQADCDDLRYQFDCLIEKVEALGPSRPGSLALTKLEEAFMWTGKALRDRQVKDD